jgi:regulator of replication initiation timing
MTVEAIRALNLEIEKLKKTCVENPALEMENAALKAQLSAQAAQLDKITAALQGAGIAFEK